MKKYFIELVSKRSFASLYDAFEDIHGQNEFTDSYSDSYEFATEEEGRKALDSHRTEITKDGKDWIRCEYSLSSYDVDEEGELIGPDWIADSEFSSEDYKEFARLGAASISGDYAEGEENILRAVQTAFDAADVDIDLADPGEQDIHRFLLAAELDIITINEGSDGQCYAWYKDDNKEGFASVDTGEEISEARAEELGLF